MNDVNETPPGGRRWWNLFSSGADLPAAAELGALLLRLYLGCTICWRAGLSKFPLDAWFARSVGDLGFPLPTLFAWLAAMSEVAGGVLLAVGLCTRPAAFFLAFTLGVAAFRVHDVPLVSIFAWQHITVAYLWGYVFFLVAGAGRLSLDGLLRRRDAVAAGLAALVVAALAGYCATRTAPEPEDAPAVDLTQVESLAVAGSFNDWDLAALPMEETAPGVWTATIEVDAPTPVEFKFVANGSWDTSAGEADQPTARFPIEGVAEIGPNAGNLAAYLPAAGGYEFRIELPALAYSVTGVDGAGEPPAPASE
ncbi:MAG: DoxX family membrane protein [Planctomycetota bacterium]